MLVSLLANLEKMKTNKEGALGKQHPFVHFLLALLIAGIGLLISTIISFIVLYMSSGSIEGVRSGVSADNIHTMVFVQLISQLIVFILPAFFFSYLIQQNAFSFYQTQNFRNYKSYLLAIVCVVSAALFIQCMVIDKNTFIFPKSLQFFENLAKTTQLEYDHFIEALLSITNPIMLVLVFLMVAVMPAIGEELLFRGMIQQSLEKGFKNRWIAILISGVLFGLIHFEFYNFFALCFMGFVLGYVYSVTRNIYINMLMHFINNGTAIITMYLYKKQLIQMNPDDSAPMYVVALAGLIMGICLVVYWKYFKVEPIENVTAEVAA